MVLRRGTRLVEADMPRPTDAEELKIDPPGLGDLFLVPLAGGGDFPAGNRAVRDMDLAFRDVEMIEQMLAHKAAIAPRVVRRNRVIFIEVEGDDVAKAQAFLAMETRQFLVDKNRRRSRGQSQHHLKTVRLPVADELGDFLRHPRGGQLGLLENDDGNMLPFGGLQGGRQSVLIP